uniref:tRNA N(3)-methylcytidine methyltransferase n=1 Tax=Strigamia maritima TaxID=126957 RepID=T1JAC0_STRMM
MDVVNEVVSDNAETAKRPQFGQRFLVDQSKVFEHNAWDNVSWDEAQESEAERIVTENSQSKVEDDLKAKYENLAAKYWDEFYDTHENKFFKDRHWLFTEFPELKTDSSPEKDENKVVLEIGCGVGNTVFPILEINKNNVFVYCCDFSDKAVNLVKENADFDPSRCSPFVCDVTSESWNAPFSANSLDVVILIFTLSAIHPDKMPHVLNQIHKYLKPGGVVLFRDYGRYDMAQLRFKKGRCLNDNFYVRGDGTRVYFFSQDDIQRLFLESNFVEEANLVDRRLQVNRGKCLKMYRVWIQAKYRKQS